MKGSNVPAQVIDEREVQVRRNSDAILIALRFAGLTPQEAAAALAIALAHLCDACDIPLHRVEAAIRGEHLRSREDPEPNMPYPKEAV